MRTSYRVKAKQQPPPRSVTVDSLAVPPAQFDWNNSGLTNPLKAGCKFPCDSSFSSYTTGHR